MESAVSLANLNSENRTNLWVSNSPFFTTTLFVTTDSQNIPHRADFYFFDADGNLFNKVTIDQEPGITNELDLKPFLAGCKLESGFQHSHVVMVPVQGVVTARCCYLSQDSGVSFLNGMQRVNNDEQGFFPLSLSPQRESFLVAVNGSDNWTKLRCRLFLSGRMPEAVITLPPYGARILRVESEFDECAPKLFDKRMQGYLRLSSKTTYSQHVLLIERTLNQKNLPYFSCVAA